MIHDVGGLTNDIRGNAGMFVSTAPFPRRPKTMNQADSLFYHTARSIEELDRAKASAGSAACRAHEQLAFLHLRVASGLHRNGLSDLVAEWVD